MSTSAYLATTIQAVQAATEAHIKGEVANLNKQLTDSYLSEFNDWSISAKEGEATTDPPKPPMAYVVGYFNDPTSGPGLAPFGDFVPWAYPKVSTQPVCGMPPIPEAHASKPGVGKIGVAIPGGRGIWFQALDGDVTPSGTIAPGVSWDGVSGLFRRVPAFGGAGAGYFEKIG